MTGGHITVVSGLPRSGTSLMMKMLSEGGMELVYDGHRRPDADNPGGYFEDTRVPTLVDDNSWLGIAEGKAIKVVSRHLRCLDSHRRYKVILMRREIGEVIASQRRMLEHRGRSMDDEDARRLEVVYGKHLLEIIRWLEAAPQFGFLEVDYNRLVADPDEDVRRVVEFLRPQVDAGRMRSAVDVGLYRNRSHRSA